MRLKFVNGKQRELIRDFKSNGGLSWKQLADLLKIKEGRLKAYVEETSLISENIYEKIDRKNEYEKFIVEKREENWGRIKGGINSCGRIKKIKEPRNSIQLAEFYGAMLGDGNSHRTKYYNSRKDKRGVYSLRIVGDSRLDKEYHLDHLKPLIENLFEVKVNSKFFKERNVMLIEVFGSKLVEFLEKKGFPPGDKIKNRLRIPEWINKNKNYLKFCLRGLYDTDGSVYKLTNQNSHQICFTNANQGLLEDVRDGLLGLGINCSKISYRDFYITKKSEIRKFLKLVGFSNNRHLKKVKMWNLDKAP